MGGFATPTPRDSTPNFYTKRLFSDEVFKNGPHYSHRFATVYGMKDKLQVLMLLISGIDETFSYEIGQTNMVRNL